MRAEGVFVTPPDQITLQQNAVVRLLRLDPRRRKPVYPYPRRQWPGIQA
jgi:hypothetical protein